MVYLTFSRKNLRKRFEDFKHFFKHSSKIPTIKGNEIVVTGTLKRYSRKDIEELIVSLGGRNNKNVSFSTGYLVVTDAMILSGRETSKIKNARHWAVPVVSENDLYEVIDRESRKGLK